MWAKLYSLPYTTPGRDIGLVAGTGESVRRTRARERPKTTSLQLRWPSFIHRIDQHVVFVYPSLKLFQGWITFEESQDSDLSERSHLGEFFLIIFVFERLCCILCVLGDDYEFLSRTSRGSEVLSLHGFCRKKIQFVVFLMLLPEMFSFYLFIFVIVWNELLRPNNYLVVFIFSSGLHSGNFVMKQRACEK